MSIVTFKNLFARACRSWAVGDIATPSKRLKYPTGGAPTMYLTHVFADWDLEAHAADALATYGVDIYVEWSSGRLFDDFDVKAAEHLRSRIGFPDDWLVALISERAKDTYRLLKVLDMARESMLPHRFAVLPVRFESMDWNPPPAFIAYPRIEERSDDLHIVWPNSTYHLPLRRWLRMPTALP
jgi:hypothetical protein